jgi:AcrR family transcriptional regulator
LSDRFNHTLKPTAETIAEAAFETLRTRGFAGATSRAIARRGGFNQALIFYHYGSLEQLLLAALRRTSEARLARYREVVARHDSLATLLPALADLYDEDKAAGHVQVVSQVVAGSLDRPDAGREALALMEPWIDLAEETLARVLPDGLPTRDLAYAAVVFYLGVNLMSHLDPGDERTDALFAHMRDAEPLLRALGAA